VNISTATKVPIIDIGFLGENGMHVNIVMIKKYIFAALRNYKIKLLGAQVNPVYLLVRILLEQYGSFLGSV